MSFIPALAAIKKLYETDSALQKFLSAHGLGSLKVKTTVRNKENISSNDLPIVMLSRPRLKRDREYGGTSNTHTVRIYAGFYQTKPDKRVMELLEFEELLSNVFAADPTLGELVEGINLGESANNEGVIDTCFMVMEIEVIT